MKEKTQLELRIEKMFENEQYKEIITEALKLYDIKEELINNIVAERIHAELYKKEQQIRSSSAYRLGKFILAPFKKIKQLLKL